MNDEQVSFEEQQERDYGLEGRIGGGSGPIAGMNSGYVMLSDRDVDVESLKGANTNFA